MRAGASQGGHLQRGLFLGTDLAKELRMTTALYSGSFDPPTLGHVDIIRRGASVFDRLVLAVGAHHSKSGFFNPEERVAMLQTLAQELTAETGCAIDVITFNGLVVDCARAQNVRSILRGIRNVTDLDYEDQMAAMNRAMAPEITTVFLVASHEVRHIASSLVRQVAMMGGNIENFVTDDVARHVRAKVASLKA